MNSRLRCQPKGDDRIIRLEMFLFWSQTVSLERSSFLEVDSRRLATAL